VRKSRPSGGSRRLPGLASRLVPNDGRWTGSKRSRNRVGERRRSCRTAGSGKNLDDDCALGQRCCLHRLSRYLDLGNSVVVELIVLNQGLRPVSGHRDPSVRNSGQGRPSRAQRSPRSPSEHGRRRIPRPVVLAWAIVWPVLTFAAVAFGNEFTGRFVPRLADRLGEAAGLSPMALRSEWPGDPCLGGSKVYAFGPAQPPSQILAGLEANPGDSRQVLVERGGTPYTRGLLSIHMGAYGDATITVDNIKVVRHEVQTAPIEWAMGGGDCGGGNADVRTYETRLDSDTPRLVLTEINGSPQKPRNRFTPFEVSAADPTLVEVNATMCAGLAAWGLEIHYTVNGQDYEVSLGDGSSPFRLSGGPLGAGVRAFGFDEQDEVEGSWVETQPKALEIEAGRDFLCP
jgi:hypothetical protein